MGISVKRGTGGQVVKFIKSMMDGIQYINNLFYSFVVSKQEELKYNGQLNYLQKRLNDLFDNSSRRIYIINSDTVRSLTVARYTEDRPIYISRYTESKPVYMVRYNEVISDSDDFVVYVPDTLSFSESEMSAIINRYKLSDKSFSINLYTP